MLSQKNWEQPKLCFLLARTLMHSQKGKSCPSTLLRPQTQKVSYQSQRYTKMDRNKYIYFFTSLLQFKQCNLEKLQILPVHQKFIAKVSDYPRTEYCETCHQSLLESQNYTNKFETPTQKHNNKCFGAYLYSAGTPHGNLHHLSVTTSRVTYFILQAHT